MYHTPYFINGVYVLLSVLRVREMVSEKEWV